MVEELERAHAAIKEIVAGIDALAAQAGKPKRAAAPKKAHSGELVAEVEGKLLGSLADAMRIKDKLENYATVDKVINDYLAAIYEEDLEIKTEKKLIAKGLKEKILRDEILGRGHRLDGRKFDEIRKITIEVGVPPPPPAAPASSRAARRRRSSSRRSARPTTSRRSKPSTARRGSASCSTTIS